VRPKAYFVRAPLITDWRIAMSMPDTEMQGAPGPARPATGTFDEPGGGWILFAGIMLSLVGILNVIWGIAAIGDSSFFVNDQRYILSGLNTWGWVTVILGAVQILAAYSVWNGNQFGRWFGIGTAGLSSIAALMSLPAYPFWSLAIFAVDILVIYGLAAYGGQHRAL
jgi:magnesium-transporting ATPase (P-type)